MVNYEKYESVAGEVEEFQSSKSTINENEILPFGYY